MLTTLSIPKFNGKVAVVGDVMLDRYWRGSSSRISPEAPVPVVKVKGREDRAGGAANVAINIAALGAPCELVGIVGADEAAVKLEKILRDRLIVPNFIISGNHPTITKLRVMARNQQLLRLDFEDAFVDIDKDSLLQDYQAVLEQSNVVICSDYGKGTLSFVQEMIKAANTLGVPILIDPKGTDFERYRGATLLTPNMSEFQAVVGPVHNNAELEQKGLELIEKFDLKYLLITRSEDGMSLLRPGVSAVHLPTRAREVYDVTGAGDTVIATLAASLACGVDLVSACELANRAAGIVVGKLGTSTVSQAELKQDILGESTQLSPGVVDEMQLYAEVNRLKHEGKRIVMTNGCFDILHKGHINYLKRARQLGDRLIVAVNTDRSVSALKGPTRPIVPCEARMEVLAALDCVDYVVPFDEDTPQRLISRVLPDVLVKGGDYKVEEIAGHREVLQNGGEVIVLPFVDGFSTTKIVNKIKEQS
ncbi:MAG: bifunctional D-glycero-beta-D-manno-heptose-7-phosphate kinase/D-glycero-beta-D-manno-heptose 1-phosphate adenylyltransferase HldE [Succinivibrio sp.]|nr:bifunctional D-glycero-beta-D-manno-heptose-7-phosphate kinase/D-glycero-beta-D-manno-heptose 1-phosphate adenylyltransferase HldE [Succinivibrio sp.]